jgi:hypothetical protein
MLLLLLLWRRGCAAADSDSYPGKAIACALGETLELGLRPAAAAAAAVAAAAAAAAAAAGSMTLGDGSRRLVVVRGGLMFVSLAGSGLTLDVRILSLLLLLL